LLGLTAVALLAAEIAGALTSLMFAEIHGVATGNWFSGDGFASALSDYGNAMLTSTLFGAAAIGLGALIRSTMIGLAVGLAWLGPFEHILQLSWSGAGRWLPGLLFDAVDVGGNNLVTYSRALLLSLICAGILFTAGTVSFIRRDVTA
jgi:hypothetical protein